MSTRILTLAGTVHPKAEVQSVDPAAGTVTFRWLDAAGHPVDSGGSVARFTPIQVAPVLVGEEATYADPSDEVLAAAIENPPAEPAAPRRQETRVVLDRLTPTEDAALFGSENLAVKKLLAKATSEGAIRDDDPDFPAARAGLDALGIIAADRWDALLAP